MKIKRFNRLVKSLGLAKSQNKHKKTKKLKKLLINKFKPTYNEYFYYYLGTYHNEWKTINNDEIIYIPKYGYDDEHLPKIVYTKNDLIILCFNSESLARELLEELQGRVPSDELASWMRCYDYEEELIESMTKYGADLKLVRARGYL